MSNSINFTHHKYIIRVIKSRRMRWAEHVLCMHGREECIQVTGGKAKRKGAIRKN
jgi:hypothetical protein